MPIVTSQSSRATSTASRTVSRNTPDSVMTWSAAKEPITASGSRRSSIAAARPIAAIESRADGSATIESTSRSGQLGGHGVAVRGAGHHHDAFRGERAEPVEGALDQGAAGAGQVEEELRRHRPRERPQPGARASGGDHGPEVVDRP